MRSPTRVRWSISATCPICSPDAAMRQAAGFLDHAASDLVLLDRLEQGAEVALAETLVALALDDLEEDRADDVAREDLQQYALALLRVAVDQDAAGAQLGERFAVPGNACGNPVVVAVRRVLEGDLVAAQYVDRVIDVG